MNEKRIKSIDRNIVEPLVNVFTHFTRNPKELKSENINDYNTFLIIRPGGIGDAILLYPMIKLLHSYGKTIDVMCMDRNKGMLSLYKKEGLINSIYILGDRKDFSTCRKNKYDCVIDTEQSFNTAAVITRLLKPKMSIGFDTNDRKYLYTHFIHYFFERYEAQNFMNLLQPFGISREVHRDDLKVQEITAEVASSISGNNLVLSTGASVEAKKFPFEFYELILKEKIDSFDTVYIVGGKGDFNDGEKLAQISPKIQNLCGKTNIEETIAVMQRCSTFIGNDSGPMHMAVIAGIKNILGIFGPTNDKKWAREDVIKVIKKDVECRPCNRFAETPYCPYGYACLRRIVAKDIISQL